MATPAQIQANRRNALLSTGPRSVEGKAASRFNALKTGIQAKSQVIPGEDPAELEELAAGYHREFNPVTPLQRFLVDSLVRAEWQLRRYHTIEARLWEHSMTPEAASLGEAYARNLQAFTRLHRCIQAAERSYYRALQELRRIQAVAPEEDVPEEVLEPAPARGSASPPELASFSALPNAPPPGACPAVNKALRL